MIAVAAIYNSGVDSEEAAEGVRPLASAIAIKFIERAWLGEAPQRRNAPRSMRRSSRAHPITVASILSSCNSAPTVTASTSSAGCDRAERLGSRGERGLIDLAADFSPALR